MNAQNKISGVVLAGGQGRRMRRQDKGLLQFKGQALVSYALNALAPLTDELMISANRNQEIYRQFGYPVLADSAQTFDGPLAGILAAMRFASHPLLLVCPCDSPYIQTRYLQRLLTAINPETDLSYADDGLRIHPVFMAVKINLRENLNDFLENGDRKIQTWIRGRQSVPVDFSDAPEIFANINTPEQLAALESEDSE
ncbi:MAG: molybdenum cofactor guanylyltransferase MobA [Methylomonas sp.]|jgi:molybdopterin-guanine dinucleotide biosynthesis protein A